MALNIDNDDNGVLYLHRVTVETPIKSGYRVKVNMDGSDIQLTNGGNSVWISHKSLEVSDSSKVHVTLKTGHTVAGVSLRKEETVVEIDVRNVFQEFLVSMKPEILVSKQAMFRQQPATITVSFRSPPTSELVRSTLQNLQEVMREFRHIMGDSTQKTLDIIIKYGVALSELNPLSKAAFNVLAVTLELLKQQKQQDQMVSGLIRQLNRVLPFADETLKEAVEDNTDILRKAIERLYVLTMDVAQFSCDYVKRNRFKRLAKAMIATQDQDQISTFTSAFGELVEDFDRAVNVEMLKTVRSMEEKMLLDRLQPIQTGHRLDRGCMEGTRVSILDEIVEWAIHPYPKGMPSEAPNSQNIFWLYGIPGIGKTAMAHSLCARLHREGRLGGTFFCRRDDPDLSHPKSVLPTLVFNLAETWGPYRKLIADKLRKDPKLTRHSADDQLFSHLLESLDSLPPHPLVLVIDALDECGDIRGRSSIISSLFDTSSRVKWLRIIVTSRQDSDIENCFKRFDGLYLARDLENDENAHQDIYTFTRSKLSSVASQCGLPKDWPGDRKVDEIVERSGGLFIFVETLSQLVEGGLNADRYLTQALSVGSGSVLERLYSLYATAIRSRIGQDKEEFRSAMATIIVVGLYRPLSDESVAQLSGLSTNIVSTLVNKLGSILYRDTKTNGGIRVRHLSVIDFLTGSSTPEDLKVDTKQAHRDVGVACLKIMTQGLRFNICGIESSLMSNRDVVDLQSRVDLNISNALKYSCTHWSDHLSHIPETNDGELMAALDTFTEVPRLLYWMEALSVMGKVAVGDSVLRRVPAWLKMSVEKRIDDGLRFILTFKEAITTSAPHIYISGLEFVPTDTDIWRCSSVLFRNLLVVDEGRRKSWPARPSILIGHLGGVYGVACSADGRRIISCSEDGMIRIWDTETRAAVGEPLEGHTNRVRSLVYSPDGRHLISGSDDRNIRIWDAQTGVAVRSSIGHTNSIRGVAYSPDGRCIISGSLDKTIRIWDAETGAPVGNPLKGHTDGILCVAYSPDGRRIISGSRDTTIRVWDASNGAAIGKPFKGHSDWVGSVAYSPNGHHIISGSRDMTIRIWDDETGVVVGSPLQGHDGAILCVAYSPDGRRIISGSDGKTIHIWDAETGAAVGEPLKGHTGHICSVIYSPDGRLIISGAYDMTIRIWNAETGAAIGDSLDGHHGAISSVAYSPNGHRIISGSDDATIRTWDAETGAQVGRPLKGHIDWIRSLAYSPDGRQIISCSRDKTIRIWDAETGDPIRKPLEGHTNWIRSVAYSPDGRHIISGSDDRTIRIWNVDTGFIVMNPLEGHTDWICSVAYSPDGRHIISGSYDRTIRIWDAHSGASIGNPLEGHNSVVSSVVYSPDGRRIISGSRDTTIRVWDAATGAAIGDPLEGHTDWVRSVAYSPDGCHIISGSYDGTIRIWDAQTGDPIGMPLRGHEDRILTVAYSPDGRHIISGSDDRTVRIWDARTGATSKSPIKRYAGNIPSVIRSPDGSHSGPGSGDHAMWIRNPAKDLTNVTISFHPDSNGWVHHPDGGFLFWVPEDCRNGLTCPAILTIPITGRHRVIRLNLGGFSYGESWTDIGRVDS